MTSIAIEAGVHARVAALCEKRHWKIRDVVASVLDWWLHEPPPVQRAILEDVDEEMEDAYAEVLDVYGDALKGLANSVREQKAARLSSSPAASVIPPEHRGKTVVLKRGAVRKI